MAALTSQDMRANDVLSPAVQSSHRLTHTYPYIISPQDGYFEMLGLQLGATSKDSIADAAVVDDMTAEWEDLQLYLTEITQHQAMYHVPLASHSVAKNQPCRMYCQHGLLQDELSCG